MNQIGWGLIAGSLFGAALYQAKLLCYEEQVSAMVLKKMSLLKFYMSAQLMSLTLLSILRVLKLISVSHSAFNLFDAIVGGLVFGIGWGLLGYCPASCSGAIGAGQVDGLFGLMGILCGAIISIFIFPLIAIYSAPFFIGYSGLSDPLSLVLSTITMIIIYLFIFYLFEKHGL